jgi:hypothetical protein
MGYFVTSGVSGTKTTDTIGRVELDNSDLSTSNDDIVVCQKRDEAWSELYRCAITANGAVRFYMYEKPTVDLPFRILVWR